MQEKSEPIVARATAPGRGGIGIVRISGDREDVSFIAKALFGEKPLEPRHAYLKEIKDSHEDLIDQAIVLFFPAPHSYTAETVLEIQAHGGLIVVDRIIKRALEVGARVGIRLARPGEFTERAFLNGRIDLAQAEAVADLIDAGSEALERHRGLFRAFFLGKFRNLMSNCFRYARMWKLRLIFQKKKSISLKKETFART